MLLAIGFVVVILGGAVWAFGRIVYRHCDYAEDNEDNDDRGRMQDVPGYEDLSCR